MTRANENLDATVATASPNGVRTAQDAPHGKYAVGFVKFHPYQRSCRVSNSTTKTHPLLLIAATMKEDLPALAFVVKNQWL